MISGFSRALLMGLLALLFAGCGGSNQSAASKKSAYLKTLQADWLSYSTALSKVSAACPVPSPTLKTMHRCKLRTLALIKVDKAVIDDLGNKDAPMKLQKPVGALTSSLADLDDAMTTLIRRYIDKNDVAGFQTSGGPGSPIDNGIQGANAAVVDIDRLEPTRSSHRPSSCRRHSCFYATRCGRADAGKAGIGGRCGHVLCLVPI